MPVEEFGGGPISQRGRRPTPGASGLGTAPTSRTPAPSGGYSRPSGTSSGSGSGSGSGSTPVDPYAAAQARAEAAANSAARKAASRYDRQAKNLEGQARALMHALRVDLKKGLRQQLGDIGQVMRQQDKILREGFRERLGQLEGASEDNEKAAASQTGINLENQVRERGSAVSEAMAQGAGESDALKAMMMSLRNWNANQTEIERGFHDTLRSINSSKTDLVVDTKTARINNAIQANADREQLWTNYYNQRSELFTQLGNTRGQQADYKAMAAEVRPGKGENLGKKKKGGGGGGAYVGKASRAFMQAAKQLGKSWDNPGVPKKLMRWDGPDDFAASRGGNTLAEVKTVSLDKRPEGATLRKW